MKRWVKIAGTITALVAFAGSLFYAFPGLRGLIPWATDSEAAVQPLVEKPLIEHSPCAVNAPGSTGTITTNCIDESNFSPQLRIGAFNARSTPIGAGLYETRLELELQDPPEGYTRDMFIDSIRWDTAIVIRCDIDPEGFSGVSQISNNTSFRNIPALTVSVNCKSYRPITAENYGFFELVE
ncbi:MAG: hypothetical protein KBC38_02750 [Candidatus Pacebacteria bacterium]|nr:hypothetical protein [Candidatus Paceibacterota bacterium]MBP9840324.1 hypothetical protein [Candidatus Paceibacterota bacterium]